jgi:hypothetical protein
MKLVLGTQPVILEFEIFLVKGGTIIFAIEF